MLFEQETYTMCSSYHTLTSVAVTANTLESISGPLLYFALFTSQHLQNTLSLLFLFLLAHISKNETCAGINQLKWQGILQLGRGPVSINQLSIILLFDFKLRC